MIGGLVLLNDWEIRSEISNALGKIFIKNINTNKEEEVKFTDEEVIVPGVSLLQKDKNTDLVHLSYSSPKTQSRVYLYNLKTKEKKEFFIQLIHGKVIFITTQMKMLKILKLKNVRI